MRNSRRRVEIPARRLAVIAICLLGVALLLPFGLLPAIAGSGGSGDFQWSGARFLLHGTNPFQVFLSRGSAVLVGNQNPNYLHLIYLVLLPFGALPFAVARVLWAVSNLVMAAVTVTIVSRRAGFDRWGTAGLAGLMACSGPFVIAMASGQQTLLVMGMSTIAFACTSRPLGSGFALALAMAKYSFAPVAVGLAVRGQRKTVVWAAGAAVAAWLVFALITRTPLITAALGPLRVGRWMAKGSADMMTISGMLVASPRSFVTYVVAVLGGVALLWWSRRVLRAGHVLDALSVCSLISLVTFPHLMYDYSVLFFPLVSGLLRRGRARAWVLFLVGLFWFGWLIGGLPIGMYHLSGVVISYVLLISVLGTLISTRPVEVVSASTDPATEGVRPHIADTSHAG